ncbi:unnamed protein product [Bursaphelenchus xylophilus]|uniref:(pine wood nematode) hypothetical protein n=1 Tax=Bursaphelenchus xylophilus TaxID=6326 RepID=A0A7I8WR13_BURXY|nr:unnamed protein product [Bursaphelenchus xylophilus]CAG9097616.1 unnamed protein product [Bursaphelenchus xylophilus]
MQRKKLPKSSSSNVSSNNSSLVNEKRLTSERSSARRFIFTVTIVFLLLGLTLIGLGGAIHYRVISFQSSPS